MSPTTIDPGVITLIQAAFLVHIDAIFATTAHYAFNLLYLFAALELTILGIVWALQREVGWDKLFFKIIKIGLIFFVIQNYPALLDTILHSFTKLAGLVTKDIEVAPYVFNPAKIWQYGYDAGINLLKLASSTNIFGLSMTQMSLGMGILLVFGLLGILMVVQMVSFYVVAFGALVFLPFGAINPGSRMFDQAVRAVFQAGTRLMILIIIIGIAVITWDSFELADLATTSNFNINQPLGLFFTALLFLCLAFYLPKILSQAVGSINSSILETNAPIVTIRESATAPSITTVESMANIRAAATIPSAAASSSYIYEGGASAAAATMPTTTVITPISGGIEAKLTRDTLAQASTLSKSISEQTVKKIKEAVAEAIKEKK